MYRRISLALAVLSLIGCSSQDVPQAHKGRIEALLFLETSDDEPYKLMGIVVENGQYKSYDVSVDFAPWPSRG